MPDADDLPVLAGPVGPTGRRWDAIILAGGRASRLDGADKAALVVDGRSLLERTLAATVGAQRVVVVGPEWLPAPGATVVREHPPFAGPVAAVAAALEVLPGLTHDLVLLACDHPDVEHIVEALARHSEDVFTDPSVDGFFPVDAEGRGQWLLSWWRAGVLPRAVEAIRATGAVESASVRSLIARLQVVELADLDADLRDVDTHDDLARARGEADR